MLAAGGEVWVADETALREFPPLARGLEQARRAGGGAHQRQATPAAPSSGRSTCAAANWCTTVRERCRTDDVLAAVEALGAVRPEVPKLLIWDNAPPHHPHRVRDAAHAAGITLAFLPFRSPELMPLGGSVAGAQSRPWPPIAAIPPSTELTQRALAWLEGMSDADRLRRCGFETSKFDWLPT